MKNIKVLGISGCPTCSKIDSLINKVVEENELIVRIEKIYDMGKILEYEVVTMPGIVIDGELKISGRMPTEMELKELLS